jgi:hypothetical protein
MWQESDRYMQKWMAGVGKAIRADGKRKWHSMNFQAQSFIQKFGVYK